MPDEFLKEIDLGKLTRNSDIFNSDQLITKINGPTLDHTIGQGAGKRIEAKAE